MTLGHDADAYGNISAAERNQRTNAAFGNGAPVPAQPRPRGLILTGDRAPLFAALARAQAAFGEIKRTRTVRVTPRDSAPYTFNYAPLDEVLRAVSAALNANEVALLQPLYQEGNVWKISTILAHSSGSTLECEAEIPWPERRWFDKGAGEWRTARGSWQDFGSAVTYARRYMLAVLGIAPEEDDDGNAASGNEREASDRTGPRANTQATPPAAPKQAKPAPEKPASAPKAEAKPEPEPKAFGGATPAQEQQRAPTQPPPPEEKAPDLGKALAEQELSPRIAPISDAQNAQAHTLFLQKVWPRKNMDTGTVEALPLNTGDPAFIARDRNVRRMWLKEVMGIADPGKQLTSAAQMAEVIKTLEALPNKAGAQ